MGWERTGRRRRHRLQQHADARGSDLGAWKTVCGEVRHRQALREWGSVGVNQPARTRTPGGVGDGIGDGPTFSVKSDRLLVCFALRRQVPANIAHREVEEVATPLPAPLGHHRCVIGKLEKRLRVIHDPHLNASLNLAEGNGPETIFVANPERHDMARIKAWFPIPLKDNDGRELTLEIEDLRAELLITFTGRSFVGYVQGAYPWQMGHPRST